MYKKLILLSAILLTSSTLLESCGTKSLFPLPAIETSIAEYPRFKNPEDLETRTDLIIVGKPQANLEDCSSTSVPESESLKKKVVINNSVVVTDDTDRSMASPLSRF